VGARFQTRALRIRFQKTLKFGPIRPVPTPSYLNLVHQAQSLYPCIQSSNLNTPLQVENPPRVVSSLEVSHTAQRVEHNTCNRENLGSAVKKRSRKGCSKDKSCDSKEYEVVPVLNFEEENQEDGQTKKKGR
jgi:hypothetical protein